MQIDQMKIVRYPHPALRRVAKALPAIDKTVHLVAGKMIELMHEAKGLGLAGNQVAWPFQMIILNLSTDPQQQEPTEPGVFINPVILEKKGAIEEEEGCLSLPDLYQRVRRAKQVKVLAYNLKGDPVEISAADLGARAWQHEIDHLLGILFIDKLGPIAKLSSRNKLREFEAQFAKAQERGEVPPTAEIEKELDALLAEGGGASCASS
jgi:peptide deformylase